MSREAVRQRTILPLPSRSSSFFFLLTLSPSRKLPSTPTPLHSGSPRLDTTREFEKTLKQIEKRIEDLADLSRSCNLDIDPSIQAVRAQLEALRTTARPADPR